MDTIDREELVALAMELANEVERLDEENDRLYAQSIRRVIRLHDLMVESERERTEAERQIRELWKENARLTRALLDFWDDHRAAMMGVRK